MKLKIKYRRILLACFPMFLFVSVVIAAFADFWFAFPIMILGFICWYFSLHGITEQRALEEAQSLTQQQSKEAKT